MGTQNEISPAEIETNKKERTVAKAIKLWSAKFLVLSISVTIGLLLGEAIIRMLYQQRMVLFPRYHTDASYGDFRIRKIRSNMKFSHTSRDGTFHFSTNNKGQRNNSDINYQKEKGELRIVSIGDSHTQGYEVNQDETFSSVAESWLAKQGLNATVINAGVSGFSTEEALVFVENEGYKYSPDYIVLGFSGNDFEDNLRCQIFDLVDDSLVVKSTEYLPGISIQNQIYKFWLFRFLGEHSYLYSYTFSAIWEFYKKGLSEDAKNAEIEYARNVQDSISNYSEQLMKKLIVRLDTFCKKKGMKLIIIDIPNISGQRVVSSIPQNLQSVFKQNCDKLFSYEDMNQDYKKLGMIHVKHGHRHISREAHDLLGRSVANYVLSDIK